MKTTFNLRQLRGPLALGALLAQGLALTWQGTPEGQAFLQLADLAWAPPLAGVVMLATLTAAIPSLFQFFQLAERPEHP